MTTAMMMMMMMMMMNDGDDDDRQVDINPYGQTIKIDSRQTAGRQELHAPS
jgi:hypothetical protein